MSPEAQLAFNIVAGIAGSSASSFVVSPIELLRCWMYYKPNVSTA